MAQVKMTQLTMAQVEWHKSKSEQNWRMDVKFFQTQTANLPPHSKLKP